MLEAGCCLFSFSVTYSLETSDFRLYCYDYIEYKFLKNY